MNEQADKKGKVVIVSGPSGVGKSTICKEAAKQLKNTYLSVSVTTRPKADSEVDGEDYCFISEEEFNERFNKGQLLEQAEVFGHRYGTPKAEVEQALRDGKTVILEIDVQGGLPRIIRVLMHVETDLTRAQIRHVYLGEAAKLRPDLAGQ